MVNWLTISIDKQIYNRHNQINKHRGWTLGGHFLEQFLFTSFSVSYIACYYTSKAATEALFNKKSLIIRINQANERIN